MKMINVGRAFEQFWKMWTDQLPSIIRDQDDAESARLLAAELRDLAKKADRRARWLDRECAKA